LQSFGKIFKQQIRGNGLRKALYFNKKKNTMDMLQMRIVQSNLEIMIFLVSLAMVANSIFSNLSRSRRRRANVNLQLTELQRLSMDPYPKRIWVVSQTQDWQDNILER